jgi:hypothetical protein
VHLFETPTNESSRLNAGNFPIRYQSSALSYLKKHLVSDRAMNTSPVSAHGRPIASRLYEIATTPYISNARSFLWFGNC